MVDESFRDNADKIDATLREERDRLVAALRGLADRLEKAPLDRMTRGLQWIATTAETLIRTVESALSRDK